MDINLFAYLVPFGSPKGGGGGRGWWWETNIFNAKKIPFPLWTAPLTYVTWMIL